MPESTAQTEAEALAASGLRMGFLERRRLGMTFGNALRIAKQMKKEGTLIYDDPQAAAAQVAAVVVSENVEGFKVAATKDGRDWAGFLEALAAFFEKMMPMILQLIEIFGAFA